MPAFLSLILILLIAGLLVTAAAIYLMARGLVRPPRMTDGKALHVLKRLTPRDLDLPYDDCTCNIRDERNQPLKLAAWWIPSQTSSSRTVILIHGYADAKIGSIAWAPVWHELGFNVLALDLRAHGDSGGTLCSGGFHERNDVAAVVRELVAERAAQTRTLLLFGASMGAAAAAGAAEILTSSDADSPLIHGVVLDSPFSTFRSASAAHFQRLGLPGGFIARGALRLAEKMTDADFAAIDLPRMAGALRCPLLIIAPAADAYLPAESVAMISQALAQRPGSLGAGRLEQFENVGHLMAAVNEPERYRRIVADFVGQCQTM